LNLGLLQAREESAIIEVNQDFYHIAKRWERLTLPSTLESSKILKYNSTIGSLKPPEVFMKTIYAIEQAIIKSYIGLEAVNEGIASIQDSLHTYDKAGGSKARSLAERFQLRAGLGLVTHNFLKYYPINKWQEVDNPEKLGSIQGREFFERTILEAYKAASPAEKEVLKLWLEKAIDKSSSSSYLKVPTDIF